MSTEIRKALEKELLARFEQTASSRPHLKAGKNKLSLVAAKEKLGEIYIQHLRNADGYYAGLEIHACEALNFCKSQSPPYPSRLTNASCMSKTSLSEEAKSFGDELGGIIRIPPFQEAASTATKINDRIVKFYLPKAENCILGTTSLIEDILVEPSNYAYPFLTSLYVAHKNGLDLSSDLFHEVLSTKAVFGNKNFDVALANELLKS
ncbi:hypothetical protein [Xanthomonas sp. 1678]|uniref:hypothetical protein n=1 Tax=Xanthomonas sp. 1678 TaxID=3158788 RepID=UPI002861E078|nr:hypothetical protein [Xanthomonas translucens]